MKQLSIIVIILVIILNMTGCLAKDDMSKTREVFAQNEEGDIVVGIPGPISYMKDITGFYNGLIMAIEEVNLDGVLKGRQIKARIEDDKGTFSEGIKIAQEFASQKDMIAVIGHWNTYITLPAARIYNDAGLVMLSPIVSNTDLTKKGYEYIFQNTISDYEMGRQMAEYMSEKGYKRIVVFYADNEYGRGLAGSFEDTVSDNGGAVVDRMTEFVNIQEFNEAFERWKAFDYDAVFIADSMPHAGDFIKMLKGKDKNIPVFAGDGLDMADLPSMLGEAGEGIVVATMYNPNSNNKLQKDFIGKYKTKYTNDPDVWAAQGYDSIKLLTYAIEKTQMLSPSAIAQVLHNNKEWTGVMGSAEFNSDGSMAGRSIYKKIIKNGKMKYLDN